MASQIQNPFNGGAALAGMANLARVNPLEATGNSMQALAQMQERFKLADLMGQNGGNVTQEMAPIAMLADQQGRDMFGNQQNLQRDDRRLGQGDRQLDQGDVRNQLTARGQNMRSATARLTGGGGGAGSNYFIDPDSPMGQWATKNGLPTGQHNYGSYNKLFSGYSDSVGAGGVDPKDFKTSWENAQKDPLWAKLSEDEQAAAYEDIRRTGKYGGIKRGKTPGMLYGTNPTYTYNKAPAKTTGNNNTKKSPKDFLTPVPKKQ